DHVKSHDPGGTARGEDQAGEDIDQRRLAGAIRAEEAEEFALLDLQTYFVERRERAIALGGALYLNGGNQGTYLTCRCAYAVTVHCSPSNSGTPESSARLLRFLGRLIKRIARLARCAWRRHSSSRLTAAESTSVTPARSMVT